jgi:selenocysteine lyase/cysteine desulfurase
MRRLLKEKSLQISMTQVQGRWRLRLSPHVYVTDAELERAFRVLAEL